MKNETTYKDVQRVLRDQGYKFIAMDAMVEGWQHPQTLAFAAVALTANNNFELYPSDVKAESFRSKDAREMVKCLMKQPERKPKSQHFKRSRGRTGRNRNRR